MSYVRHKTRAFRNASDIPELVRRRSEGRLKNYPSTEDARAWCDVIDDRRQQILDYIISDIEQCSIGKYVPIDVLISTLLANKNSDCGKLKEQVDELQKLLDLYSNLELTEEQKNMLQGMKRRIGRAGENLSNITAKTTSGSESCAAIKREQEGVPCGALDTYNDKNLKSLIIEKDAQIIALKNQLAVKQSELDQIQASKSIPTANQPTDGFKEVTKERDDLKKELQASKHEIQSLRSRIEEPCVQEIERLEKEIQRLKSKGQLTADEEAEIIRKEIEVLKKYCAKLATIQEENQSLKQQVEALKSASQSTSLQPSTLMTPQVASSATQPLTQKLRQSSVSSTSVPLPITDAVKNEDIDTLKQELNNKITKLNEVIAERDKLKEKIKQLEKELMKYQSLPDDINTMRQKSQMLDSVSDECKKLRTSLESMKTVEEEMSTLKKKASKANKLQSELESVNKEIVSIKNQSAAEIQTLKSKNDEVIKERESYKKVAMEAKGMGEELKCLAHCAKEAEALKRERDSLQAKLQKLSGIEAHYKQLQDKVKYLENIKSEREMYKMKYEEMLGLECDCEMLKAQVDKFKDMDKDRASLINQVRDCECCIAEQEEEIKKLIAHIDNMSRGNNEQQARLHKEINNMRNELKQKNNIIATSEKQLSCVQEQLKKTIKGVSCETSCLRLRIIELQEQLSKKTNTGNTADKDDKQLAKLKSTNVSEETSDEHYKEMLAQSKYAVKRISEELEKHFKEWESIKKEDLVRLNTENKTLKQISVEAQQTINTGNANANAYDNVIIQYEEAKLKIEALENQLAEYQADIERLTAECTTLKQLSAETQYSADKNIQQKYEAEKGINDELQQQLNECKATIEQLLQTQSEVDRLNAENNALKKLSVDLQNNVNDEMDKLTDRLKDANIRIFELESLLKNVEDEREQLDKILRQYKETEVLGDTISIGDQNETGKIGEKEQRVVEKTDEIEELKMELIKCKTELEKEIKHRQEQECAYRKSIASQSGSGLVTTDTMADNELKKCRKEKDELLTQIQNQKNEIAAMIEKSVSPDLVKERKEKEGMQNLIDQLQKQISAMESGASVVDNEAFNKLKTQLEKEQKKATLAETKLKEICEQQGLSTPEIDVSDVKRLSQAYEERLSQSMMELELANSIKKQQDQEIKSLHNKFNDSIVKLQTSHEEVLKEVDAEHAKELENLLTELRSSKETIASYEKLIESDKQSLSNKSSKKESINEIGSQKDFNEKVSSDNVTTGKTPSEKEPGEKEPSEKEPSEKEPSEKVPSEKVSSEKMLGEKVLSEKMLSEEMPSEEVPSEKILIEKVASEKMPSERERSDEIKVGSEKSRTSHGTMASIKKSSLSKETQDNVAILPTDRTNAETSPKTEVCKCGAALHAILQKIVQSGLESLNFEELQLLHNKTCEATAALVRKCPCENKNVPFTCGQVPTDDDRQRLIKRIAALENDLLKKQKQTQDKVGALQVTVRMERQRLQDFKSLLDTEKNRNNELMCKIGAQSRTVANMQIERESMLKKSSFNEEKLQSLVLHCEQEKYRIKKLEEDLAKQRVLHKREIEALYDLQMRGRLPPPSNYPRSNRLCSCCSKGLNKGRLSMEVEVESHMPENVETKKTCAEQCCMKKHKQVNKSSRSPCQSDLEEVD